MLRATTFLLLTLTFACQSEREALLSRNTELLLPKVEAAPRLPFEKTDFVPQPPSEGWEIDFASSTAAGPNGELYVLQRGSLADPVVVLDMEGRVLRSWGAGLYSIPHSIRVDTEGNVWTVDAGTSHINKFTPEGERLLHINVGEMPIIESMFKGTADIAFAPDGHLFIADGYGNARILEYGPEGRCLREWASPEPAPANSTCRTPSRSTSATSSTLAIEKTAASSASTATAVFSACGMVLVRHTRCISPTARSGWAASASTSPTARPAG
jgi:hypothetical protein